MTDARDVRFNPFRVIPCLLVDEENMVKTERFRKGRYLGDVVNALRIFNEKEVDEVAILDIGASRARRAPNVRLIAEMAGECFMPVAYGGGITTAAEVREIIKLGIEKVIIGAAALEAPGLITEAASEVGSQSIVAAIDVRKNWLGRYSVVTRSATRNTGIDPQSAVERVTSAGAGEILLQSVDRDGTMEGYDLDLIRRVCAVSRVPVIAAGGAKSASDLAMAVKLGGAAAVAAGALFVYQGPHRAVLISYPSPREIHDALNSMHGNT